jgi:hypothetical protein
MGEQRIDYVAEGFVVEQIGFGRIGMWVTLEGEGYMQRERICKAVSCHHDLLEALEELTSRVDTVMHRGYVGNVIQKAYKAIAKAKA